MIKNIIESMEALFFPYHCPLCQKFQKTRGTWCENCLEKTLRPHRIPLTKKQLQYLDEAYTLGSYQGVLKKLICKVKFDRDKKALPYLQNFLLKAKIPKNFLEIHYALKIPLAKEREKERTFNQNDLFFDSWLKINKIFPKDLLIRQKNTKPQYGLSRQERAQNIKNAFQIQKEINIQLASILIVDDIFTTGLTITECAKILKQKGARKILALTLASDHT